MYLDLILICVIYLINHIIHLKNIFDSPSNRASVSKNTEYGKIQKLLSRIWHRDLSLFMMAAKKCDRKIDFEVIHCITASVAPLRGYLLFPGLC